MTYVIVCGTALLAAGLTLFSGFGLGTLLLPAFLLFFPVEVAVAATAVVHLANNLFKTALLGRAADVRTVIVFGVPAALAAFAGAALLDALAALPPVLAWELLGRVREVTLVKMLIGALIFVFAILDLVPALARLEIDRRWLPLGGALSGFFGGLSGHQGALRAAFLVRLRLSQTAFVATGTLCAVIVDVARLAGYGGVLLIGHLGAELGEHGGWSLVGAATVAAMVGSFASSRLLPKITMRAIRWLVGAMLMTLALALGGGLI